MADPIRYRTLEATEFEPRRRVRVVVRHGFEGYIIRWTDTCSGCRVDFMEYDEKLRIPIGMGCSECGYTGKRHGGMFMPFDRRAFEAWCDKRWERRERLIRFFHSKRSAA